MSIVDFLKSIFLPYKEKIVLVSICLIIEAAFYCAVPFSFKYVIDSALIEADGIFLIGIFSSLGLGAIISTFLNLKRSEVYAEVISSTLSEFRIRLFKAIQDLPMGFYMSSNTREIPAYFSADLAAIENMMQSAISWAVLPFLSFLLNIILLFVLNWKLTLIALFTWPIILRGPHKISALIERENKTKIQKETSLISLVQENIMMHLPIKSLGLQGYSKRIFLSSDQEAYAPTKRVSFLSSILVMSGEMTATFLQILMMGIGAIMVLKEYMSVGALVAFQAIFTTLTYSLSNLTQYLPTLVKSFSSVNRIYNFISQNHLKSKNTLLAKESFEKEIQFQNVKFYYDPSKLNLDDVSFAISRGETVAFVGPSGSGKSTVLNLILGLYQPIAGNILVDQMNLNSIDDSSLRSLMRCVFQESLLFNMSIRDNIRMGKLNATDEEIESAARAAEIHQIILSLPQAYDTLCGERGGQLSGGQRQRIAIARAIISNPPILILDEATSALDPIAASAVNETLKRLSHGRTNIIVTHRLDEVTHCDRIFVFQGGKIQEQGDHESLLKSEGVYYNLWNKQHGVVWDAEGNNATMTIERLRAIPLFEDMDSVLLEGISDHLSTLTYLENKIVFEEGDVGDLFYFIVRGRVEVLKKSSQDSLKSLNILEEGDYFGEIALLKKTPRTASIRTKTPCVFLTLRSKEFLKILDKSPETRKRIEQIMEERTT